MLAERPVINHTALPSAPARLAGVDLARGLGIIAVVVGHSQALFAGYVYFFHMPLFFLLSGLLAKPAGEWAGVRARMAKSARRHLLPYLSFLLIFTAIRYLIIRETHFAWYARDLRELCLGGSTLVGVYAPCWFITCLFITQLLFEVLHVLVKRRAVMLLLIAAAYVLAHLEAATPWLAAWHCPWSADIALLALTYYGVGYYARPWVSGACLPKITVPLTLTAAIAALILPIIGVVHFWLDLKTRNYHDYLLDLCIPLALSVAVCYLANWLSRWRWSALLASLGTASLTVMYLHMSVNAWVLGIPSLRGPLPFILIGLLIPWLLFHPLFQRVPSLRLLFLGQRKSVA